MKKILVTGSKGMFASDFIKRYNDTFDIIGLDKEYLDITNISSIEKTISNIKPDIVLNCAAYTAVDNAEDIGMKLNYDINTLGVYNLAKITKKYGIDFITISTDYIFNGTKEEGYNEYDECNPINAYGMSKYLGEKLSKEENNETIIIRTSWLYGGGKEFKNFVNTMIKLSETHDNLKVINDQFGIPTYTVDLANAIIDMILNIDMYKGSTFHFSNSSVDKVTWFDFAKEIFKLTGREIKVNPCGSDEYKTKAKRPQFSRLLNNSDIKLRDWKEGLKDYISNNY
ncbi:MAG: dTDP-4-dehydrorhamnose reductase [Candidatus Gracilibacteria bacterium]|nr:dTDP-4-dehydrorhamnose reductase [Candidatus Gracilibacteria bacterium]